MLFGISNKLVTFIDVRARSGNKTNFGYSIKSLDCGNFLKFYRLESQQTFLIISISVLAMVVFNSLAADLTTNILLMLILYNWRVIRESSKKQL